MRKFLLLFLLSFSLLEARVVFVHMPKCGGTTLHYLLKKNYPNSDIYPLPKLQNGLADWSTTQADMDLAFQIHPDIDHELVSGHFPIWFLKKKNPYYDSSYVFTILRDPIERVLSHDRFQMRVDIQNNKSPSSKLDSIPKNFLCKMLCSDCTLQGEELLQDCIANLEKMDYVIFLDDFENGVRGMFQDLGLRPPKRIGPRNTSNSQELHDLQAITPEKLAKIKEDNALDIQLYEYATKYFC